MHENRLKYIIVNGTNGTIGLGGHKKDWWTSLYSIGNYARAPLGTNIAFQVSSMKDHVACPNGISFYIYKLSSDSA